MNKLDKTKRMSEAQKGLHDGNKNSFYGKKHTLESKLKMSKSHIGKKHSKKTVEKMKGNKNCLGRKLSEETKEKIRLSRKKYVGKNHPRWIEDRDTFVRPDDWTDTLRESIRQRDNYICQECGIHQDELIGRFKKLDVHHIDYDKQNCNPNNLITLCRSCHSKTNTNRNYWIIYYK